MTASREMTGSAVAHPIQGLIKYHGLKRWDSRIPYHDSISVCMAAFQTHTTVRFSTHIGRDTVIIDGREVFGRPLERVSAVLEAVRKRAASQLRAVVVSENSFDAGIGLGASASGFAALAAAAASALLGDVDSKALSGIARLGSGSAARSVAGGFAHWAASDVPDNCIATRLAGPDDLDFVSVVIPIASHKSTEDAHREAPRSPLFAGRLQYIDSAIRAMRNAIARRDTEEVGRLAELDSLNLHAVTWTGPNGLVLWEAVTLEVIKTLRRLRGEGAPVHFSIDTGASVYANTRPRHAHVVRSHMARLGLSCVTSHVGEGARETEHHLAVPSSWQRE